MTKYLLDSADVVANQELKILHSLSQRIHLISQPKIRETDIEEGGREYPKNNFQAPKSCIILQRLGGIEHEHHHYHHQRDRHYKGVHTEAFGVEK